MHVHMCKYVYACVCKFVDKYNAWRGLGNYKGKKVENIYIYI